MGRHTTPGVPAPHGQRDDVVGWGAFATALAAVLVGLTAGWVHAVTVALLGGLVTSALWFVRSHPDAGAGRGRHASDTPWSASDLLDLKDDVDERPAPPAGPATGAPAAGTRRSGRRRAEPAATGTAGPLEWVPAVRTSPEADLPWPDQAADGAGAHADDVHDADGPDGATGPLQDDPLPGRRRSGRRAARGDDGAVATQPAAVPGAATVTAAQVTAAPVAAVPLSRRSRRAAEEAGGPTRPVLPVAPFGAVPARAADPTVEPAAEPATAPHVEPHAEPHVEQPPGPPPAQLADPLAGPVDPGSLAAEPAVLDPALDGLWPAPVLELTVEQPLPPGLAADAAAAAAASPAPDPVTAAVPAPERATPGPEPVAPPHDRERAAAELDPLWARRARRPQGPRRAHERPAAQRREPQPVVLQPVPGYAGTAPAEAEPAEPVDGGGPLVVVLPEPDVPDVLMLPESDVVQDGTDEAAPTAADDPAWAGGAGRPAGRPEPGTLSLDELLVLHTRRPGGRRAGSADRPGDEAARRLE